VSDYAASKRRMKFAAPQGRFRTILIVSFVAAVLSFFFPATVVVGILVLWGLFEAGGVLGRKVGYAEGYRAGVQDGADDAVHQMAAW
jgi:hypothetical protein